MNSLPWWNRKGDLVEKVGVCLIGCGGISRSHIRAYSEIKEVNLLAVVDIDESCALAAKEESGARFSFTDYARALEMDEVDMVDICLPTQLHAEAVIAAAKSGKHILTEKPIALTLEDADKMSRAASDAGVKFTVGFGLRFSTRMMKFAQLVREGALGRPVIFRSVNSRAGEPCEVEPCAADQRARNGRSLVGRKFRHTRNFV